MKRWICVHGMDTLGLEGALRPRSYFEVLGGGGCGSYNNCIQNLESSNYLTDLVRVSTLGGFDNLSTHFLYPTSNYLGYSMNNFLRWWSKSTCRACQVMCVIYLPTSEMKYAVGWKFDEVTLENRNLRQGNVSFSPAFVAPHPHRTPTRQSRINGDQRHLLRLNLSGWLFWLMRPATTPS